MDVGQTTSNKYYKCHKLVTTGDKTVSHRLFPQKQLECSWGKAYKWKIIVTYKAVYIKYRTPLDRVQDRVILNQTLLYRKPSRIGRQWGF